MNRNEILNQIPDIDAFLTVEEMDKSTLQLAKTYPELVTVTKIGESRKQHPLYCLTIGNGKRKALMYGCPHPNEPIGAMMLEQLSHILCQNPDFLKELDTTFYIIKCVDPDGFNLNKGWLKGPFTYENYASHFFRPNSTAQVEWTFPIHYKEYSFEQPIPETKAIMNLMEQLKPDFVYTLHNSSFGGVYFYVSHNRKEIIDQLPATAKRANLPLHLGEPECAFSKTFAPSIYEFLQATQYYDYYEKNLDGNPCDYMVCGGSSLDYINTINPDAFVMMCEEPYFYCPESSDLSFSTTMTRREAILKGFEERDRIVQKTIAYYTKLQSHADQKSMYMQALAMYADANDDSKKAQLSLMDEQPEEFNVPATKASEFDSLIASPWYALLAFGMLIGCAKETLANTNNQKAKVELLQMIEECQRFVNQECTRINQQIPCQPIPIRTLVQVQMESAFIVLENLDKKEDNKNEN